MVIPTGVTKNVVVALNPMDTAAIVEEIGPDVTKFKPGDRVFACAKVFLLALFLI